MPHTNRFTRFEINPMTFFLIVGAIIGVLFCIFIPSGAGFDEDAHTVRIVNIALGQMLPNKSEDEGFLNFQQIFDVSYQRQFFATPAQYQFEPDTFNLKLDRDHMLPIYTRSNYFPLLYLPQVITAGIGWRIFDFPILPVIIFMRIAGLIFYLLIGAITIRLLPFGKWLFTVLALSPLALFQVCTLNGDSFTMAACFLFIGTVLHVYDSRETSLSNKKALLVAGSAILLGVAKPGTIILLPLLLILVRNKHDTKIPFLIIILGAAVSIFLSIYWSYIIVLPTKVGSSDSTRLNQILLVLNNLADFLKGYFIGISRLLVRYYRDWVASYGYWVGKVPEPVYYLFPAAIIAAYFAENKYQKIRKTDRLIMLVTALFCLGLIASVKFVFFYEPGQIYTNAQARYFLPFAPLLFLSLSGMLELKPWVQKIGSYLAAGLLLFSLGFYGLGLYTTYYTYCVYPVDKLHPCKLPQYKNLDVEDPPVATLSASTLIEQSFTPHCNKINAIYVNPFVISQNNGGEISFTLFDPSGIKLAESSVDSSDLAENKALSFNFPAQQVTPGEIYSFRLNFIGENNSTSKIGLLARKQDYYKEGRLLVNSAGYPPASDLYFQYACAQ